MLRFTVRFHNRATPVIIMTTTVLTPDAYDRDTLRRSIEDGYLHGDCYAFAAGLHRITGWPMVRLRNGNHAGVLAPDGNVWDIRGPLERETFARDYAIGDDIELVPLSMSEVHRLHHPGLKPGGTAERYASTCFPDLPHLPSSDRERNIAFMNAVERLSRKYRVHIQSPRPVPRWAVISTSEGDETYRIHRHDRRFLLDRALPSEVRPPPDGTPQTLLRFVIDLTAVSREHMFFIRAAYPRAKPRLVKGGERSTNNGYVIAQSHNAAGFLVQWQ